MEEDENGKVSKTKIKIERVGYRFGYVVIGKEKDGPFVPKTSWCISPYAYVSDDCVTNVHKIAFLCYTYQDRKTHKVCYRKFPINRLFN